ncbi:DIP1984 family protein [Desulfobacterales bacterium HSG2]|nr:DIP1984 family protein [Desulfobacterales bacterium HSG2]
MKLAEALIERKSVKTKMEEVKKRIYQNAQVQEGDEPTESPSELLEELNRETKKFEEFVIRINQTNNVAKLNNGMTIMEALTKRDMLRYKHYIYTNLADKATPPASRYSQREIKFVPAVSVSELRKKADEIAKECRLLDTKIQEANWITELL